MSALTGLAVVAAALLALAGAQKVLDPTMTVGALRGMGLPSSAIAVRVGSLLELALGVAAVTVGGSLLWWLVALSYGLFAAFVLVAMRKGTMIGSCGCFGREETPPHVIHVVLNVLLALAAGAIALVAPSAPAEALADDVGTALAVGFMAVLAVGLLYAAYVELPRALVAPRPHGR